MNHDNCNPDTPHLMCRECAAIYVEVLQDHIADAIPGPGGAEIVRATQPEPAQETMWLWDDRWAVSRAKRAHRAFPGGYRRSA